MTSDEALRELAASTAEAVAEVLRGFLPDQVEVGGPEVVPSGTPPLDGVSVPAVAAEASYIDGASGGNVFVTSITGMRKLAAAILGRDADEGSQPLDELERSAVADAVDAMMRAAAEATGGLLGEDVQVGAPEVRDLETVGDALALGEGAPYACGVTITLAGEPCRLVHLVPKVFVLKMTRALEDFHMGELGPDEDADHAGGPDEVLRGVRLRVCAEIGRASMPLSQAVTLPHGGLVELDRGAEDPVDVFVNGRHFATGRLVLVEDEWAVRIEEVLLDAHEMPTA